LIYVKWKGRFGNHLFQMSAANILSVKHDQSIHHEWNDILSVNTGRDNKVYNKNIIVNNENIVDIFNLGDKIEANLWMDDYFQNRWCIDKFIEINKYKNPESHQVDATFVHIRLGDIKFTRALSYSYYQEAIESLDNKRIILTSDSPEDEMVKSLEKSYNAEIYNGSPLDTIILGANCKKKVLSLGTFSWWIGFLGSLYWKNQETVCPLVNRTQVWHGDIFPLFNWRSF